ncbi:hypothetical protein K1719_041360 [Acacia pycnantha]|nr:hypothetical protein K1719_041360 [Acacia pycnantha]
MYPIERYLRSLKSYVRNKARPEGSIAEGYLADERITFCSHYLKDFPTKFNVPHRNDETSDDVNCEFSIFKKSGEPRGHYESINLSREEYCQATMYVLQNCEEVLPFIEEHMSELEAQGSQSQCKGFLDWFRSRVGVLSKQGHVSSDLRSLSIGPLKVVNHYSMFIGNGFRFHTKDRAIGKKTQNNGVMVKGDDINADKEYYVGLLLSKRIHVTCSIDVSGVNVVLVDEVAYQQLVVDLNIDNPTRVEHDFIINLYGEDVQHQTFVQAGEPSQRNNCDVMDIGFIDDNETHSSGREDSNEEDVLDDYESDTEIESDTENEVQENESEDTDISDSVSEESIE